jgi:hypothetical protein
MTQLEMAQKLREQIKQEWSYVSTILALHDNNKGQFTERIQAMVNKLLPDEVFYGEFWPNNFSDLTDITVKLEDAISGFEIKSLPIQVVLFATESNPLGILK